MVIRKVFCGLMFLATGVCRWDASATQQKQQIRGGLPHPIQNQKTLNEEVNKNWKRGGRENDDRKVDVFTQGKSDDSDDQKLAHLDKKVQVGDDMENEIPSEPLSIAAAVDLFEYMIDTVINKRDIERMEEIKKEAVDLLQKLSRTSYPVKELQKIIDCIKKYDNIWYEQLNNEIIKQ